GSTRDLGADSLARRCARLCRHRGPPSRAAHPRPRGGSASEARDTRREGGSPSRRAAVKKRKGPTLIGGVLLIVGLAVALITNHYEARVDRGAAVPAPQAGSREWEAKERLRREADGLFWVGVALTGAGVVLQTWAAWSEG